MNETIGWMNEWMNEWNYGMKVWMNEWMKLSNEWMNEWNLNLRQIITDLIGAIKKIMSLNSKVKMQTNSYSFISNFNI